MISISDIDAIIIDFDGVLTNNKVHLDENGKEWVSCCRSDGIAFDVLRKLKKQVYILSTEKNPVVAARAKKLKIPAIYGVNDKQKRVRELATQEGFNLKRVLYIGNDLNDLLAMQQCGYSVCPKDSHLKVKKASTLVLNSNGGMGVVRELIEEVLHLDVIKILYLN